MTAEISNEAQTTSDSFQNLPHLGSTNLSIQAVGNRHTDTRKENRYLRTVDTDVLFVESRNDTNMTIGCYVIDDPSDFSASNIEFHSVENNNSYFAGCTVLSEDLEVDPLSFTTVIKTEPIEPKDDRIHIPYNPCSDSFTSLEKGISSSEASSPNHPQTSKMICKKCKKEYSSAYILTHTCKKFKFMCELCNFGSNYQRNLCTHRRKKHTNIPPRKYVRGRSKIALVKKELPTRSTEDFEQVDLVSPFEYSSSPNHPRKRTSSTENNDGRKAKQNLCNTSGPSDEQMKKRSKKTRRYQREEVFSCSKCGQSVHNKARRMHYKYYCNSKREVKEWKMMKRLALCLRCNRNQEPDAIEFHVKYLCRKKPITVQCFYCPRLFTDYRGMLKHTNHSHNKKHKFLDLLSILPVADSVSDTDAPIKVVKHFFNNTLTAEEEAYLEENPNTSNNARLQLRQKSAHVCEKCGKKLVGTHAYENHINTKCESDNGYTCFYCSFTGEFAFQVLEHMDANHNQQFNTYDLIQAQLTGIIPVVGSQQEETYSETSELDFARRDLYEEYVTLDRPLKAEENRMVNGRQGECSKTSKVKSEEGSRQIKDTVGHIKFKNKFSLNVSKQKVRIGNKVLTKRKLKRSAGTRVTCPRCSKVFHPNDLRMHKKYECGQENVKREWTLHNSKALCLKCKTLQDSRTIDFHVKYICKKKPIAVQCFYCDKIYKDCKGAITHMRAAHNKSHYYQDLIGILSEAYRTDDNTSQANCNSYSKVLKHPCDFSPPIVSKRIASDESCNDSSDLLRFPIADNFYSCFLCDYKCKAGFKVLDHMEEVHDRKHNIYDLIRAKMASSK